MTVFKVHYTAPNGNKLSTFASADTPEAAADGVKQNVPGAIVTKVKVDKSGNVSPRAKRASVDDIVNGRAKLGINPDAKPVSMTPEDAAKLDWVHVGDPRPRHR